MIKKNGLRIYTVAVCAQLIVPVFSQTGHAANFDPYAASDAQGHYLNPPLVYQVATTATPPDSASVGMIATTQNSPPQNPVMPQKPYEEAAGVYTYQDAPSPFAPITDRILADPTFLTSKGQILGNTSYNYFNFQSVQKNYLGQKNLSEVERGNHVNQDFAYGLTDNLSLRASIGYTALDYKDSYTAGSSSRVDDSGFTNPTFGATYRVVDQKHMPFLWDINGYYTPDAFPYKEGTTTNAGTIADGRQSGEVSTSVSRVMKSLTVQATAGIDFLGDQKALHLSDGSSTDVKASNEYFTGLRSQTRLTSSVSFDLGGIYTFRDNMKGRNVADGFDYVIKQGNIADLYTGLDFQIVPNRFVASAEYDHYLYGANKYEYSQPSATNNVSWKDSGENLFLVRLHYLFF